MSYTDLRDFDAEATFTFEADGVEVTVEIAKLGGGTVGRQYTGRWRYIMSVGGTEAARGQDFDTSTFESHKSAARILFRMLSNEL